MLLAVSQFHVLGQTVTPPTDQIQGLVGPQKRVTPQPIRCVDTRGSVVPGQSGGAMLARSFGPPDLAQLLDSSNSSGMRAVAPPTFPFTCAQS